MPNLWGASPVGRDGEGRLYATQSDGRGGPVGDVAVGQYSSVRGNGTVPAGCTGSHGRSAGKRTGSARSGAGPRSRGHTRAIGVPDGATGCACGL